MGLTPGMDILVNNTNHTAVCEKMLAAIPEA